MGEAPYAIFSPSEGEKMARKEHQTGKLQTRESAQGPEWFIRYRKRVQVQKDGRLAIERRGVHHSLGLVKDLPTRKAERLRDEIMREVNGQVYTIQSHVPWEEMCRLWLEKFVRLELRPTTQKTYQQWLERYILPAFKGRKLCEVRPEEVGVFLSNLPVAPATRRSIRGVMASLFRKAREWGYWKEGSPLEFVRLRGGLVREKVVLSADELRRLLELISATPSKRYRPEDVGLIVETLVSTGMRISECLGLRWRAVDLLAGTVAVVERQCRGDVGEPKSLKGARVLPLGVLAERYRQRAIGKRPEELVFVDRNSMSISDNALLVNYLTPILKKLGLKRPGMGWHTFRRMHVTGVAPELNQFDLMNQAGHSSLEVTKLYYVGELTQRDAAVRRLQESFGMCAPAAQDVLQVQ